MFLRGELADGYIAQATVQGSHRLLWQFLATLFTNPQTLDSIDFLVYLDAAAWRTRGLNLEPGVSTFPIEREHLVYHELSHLRQSVTKDGEPRYHDDGRELLALRSHTYEVFDTELRRYGPKTIGREQIGTDYVIGAKAEKARYRKDLIRRVK